MRDTGLHNWWCYMMVVQKKVCFYIFASPTPYLLFCFSCCPSQREKKSETKSHKPLVTLVMPWLKLVAVLFSGYFYSLIILVLVLIDLN